MSESAEAVLARVRALADQWNDTPDYTPSAYDQGRVDQRHDMTQQLLEALDDHCREEWKPGGPGRPDRGRTRD